MFPNGNLSPPTEMRGSGAIHTNTVESCFSIFKRGMRGVYQHWSEMHGCLAEFDFRYSNRTKLGVDDAERTARHPLAPNGSVSRIGGLTGP